MSCWVVPSIAADLWGISVHQILENIKLGRVPSKTESGFTFVDVAPESPRYEPGPRRAVKPQTYTVVTEDERAALVGEEMDGQDESSANLGDWRRARRTTGQLRRRPITA